MSEQPFPEPAAGPARPIDEQQAPGQAEGEQQQATQPAAENEQQAPKPARLLLIRHGMNDFVGKRLAGWLPDVHLNERGQAQAEAVAERLATTPGLTIHAIYSSPLERAQETAAPMARRLGLDVQILEGVGELRCGDWQGQSIEDLSKLDLWRVVQMNPGGFRFPNGESMLEVQMRAVQALQGLAEKHAGETVAVFSHSDTIKLATTFFAGIPIDLFQRINIDPTSITEVALTNYGPRIVRVNDTAHVPFVPDEKPEDAEGAANTVAESEPAAGAAGAAGAGPTPQGLEMAGDGAGER